VKLLTGNIPKKWSLHISPHSKTSLHYIVKY